MKKYFYKASLKPDEEHCICEHAETCPIPELQCYHKGIHNLSRGSLYVTPCKLPTRCKHTGLKGVTCNTVPHVAHIDSSAE